MGKINKTICLDYEVAELLKAEKNASMLINNYLRYYFNMGEKDEKRVEADDIQEKILMKKMIDEDGILLRKREIAFREIDKINNQGLEEKKGDIEE